MARKRITFTLESTIYDDFIQLVKDYGYPRYMAGVIVQQYMEQTVSDDKKHGISPQLELFGKRDKRQD